MNKPSLLPWLIWAVIFGGLCFLVYVLVAPAAAPDGITVPHRTMTVDERGMLHLIGILVCFVVLPYLVIPIVAIIATVATVIFVVRRRSGAPIAGQRPARHSRERKSLRDID